MQHESDTRQVPDRFIPAYDQVRRLAHVERNLAAFIFGSVARDDATAQSDLDLQVIVERDNPCANINHPVIAGVKLDLTFISLAQLRARTEDEIARGERVPMLAESLIVFDKTGELPALRAQAREARPKPVSPDEHQLIHFMIYHVNDKVERALTSDPATSLLSMHTELGWLLQLHYRLQGHWQVSSKRLLPDLRRWDAPLAALIEAFVVTAAPTVKARYWAAIVDRVVAPLGGRQPIAENNCNCAICRQDLAPLLAPGKMARKTDLRT